MSNTTKTVWLHNDNDYGGVAYELVPFKSHIDHPETKGTYLLRPVEEPENFTKMTKAELIEYIEKNEL